MLLFTLGRFCSNTTVAQYAIGSVLFLEPESARRGRGFHKPHPPSVMDEVSMDVEDSAGPKKPRLDPHQSGGEGSNTISATYPEQSIAVSEPGGLLLQEVTALPYSSDEDGDSSSSGEEEEEEEEGSDMRIQVWSCRMVNPM